MFPGPRSIHKSRVPAAGLLRRGVLAFTFAGFALLSPAQSGLTNVRFSAVMPLGSDSILLRPANHRLNMLLSVECPEFAGMTTRGEGRDRTVVDSDGDTVEHYPSDMDFRFTIGSRTSTDELEPNEFQTKASIDHFQSNLHFRLKVFHGTHAKTYEPVDVKMLGVPADIPYDERIYHFSFKLNNVPVEDRMMLEVLDEDGNRVGKFHLQLL
jgi:hypothetical protein